MIVKKEDDSPNSCDCSETMEEVPSPKGKEHKDDKNFKSNSIKTLYQNSIKTIHVT